MKVHKLKFRTYSGVHRKETPIPSSQQIVNRRDWCQGTGRCTQGVYMARQIYKNELNIVF